MSEYKGVLVYCDVAEGKLLQISNELLGAGRCLADELGEELAAVIVGSGIESLAPEAIAAGADKAYVVDEAILADYQSDTYVTALEKVSQEMMPQIILAGQTNSGRDLAPRLAFRLDTASTLDCVALEIDASSKRLLQTKPVYGGNARAIYSYDTNPQIATVRAKSQTPLEPDASRKGEVIKVASGIDAAKVPTKVINQVKEEIEGIKLEDAEVVVSGGRGIGDAEGFAQLAELAKVLKGAMGASRPPCDNGWVPEGVQVGLTGKIVSPELYIAVGISGASQHMSGCSGAKTIIAINKDNEANIFNEARFGVVGDWKKVLPAFTAKVKELISK